MLQLKKLAPEGSADIFAKLEYLNPGGSVKDRAAIGMIARAEAKVSSSPAGPSSRPRPAIPASAWR